MTIWCHSVNSRSHSVNYGDNAIQWEWSNFDPSLPLPLPFLRGGWLHRWWFHPARRPQLGSNAQPQINRYGYVNLFEAFANLKRVLKRSCLDASEDIMGAPIVSLLIVILATQETWKWSEVSLSSLQSGHEGSDRSFMIVRCLLRETCPVSSPVRSCFLRLVQTWPNKGLAH